MFDEDSVTQRVDRRQRDFARDRDDALTTIDAELGPLRAMATTFRAGTTIELPGGFTLAAPSAGHVVTIAMDGGYDVHVEGCDGGAMLTVEGPATMPRPADDDTLALLAEAERRAHASQRDAAARALREARSYRRRFTRLASAYTDDGPHTSVRWVTLSFRGIVRIPGLGSVCVHPIPTTTLRAGRRIGVRRIGRHDPAGPPGSVEVLIDSYGASDTTADTASDTRADDE